jgi:hypothetical protein
MVETPLVQRVKPVRAIPFSFENPNQVTEYPLGLIPLFLVPYAVVAHILSLTQMNRDRRRL